MPFLSLDQADGPGPGKAHDLGTVLARHSLVGWSDNQKAGEITLALEGSHDGAHWHQLGSVTLFFAPFATNTIQATGTGLAWPARYVRANCLQWKEDAAGSRVSATIASA